MNFKKIITEMLDNLKKNEITISTELNNNSEIINKSKIGGKPYLPKDIKDYCEVPEFKVAFKSNISLPSYENFYLLLKEQDTLKKQDISFKDFIPLYDEIFIPDTNYTKLLGHPEVIQNPMEEECEAVTRGFDMGGVESYPKKYQKEIKSASKDWILLFQMDTVESDDYELMFGDSGHIYFWIKKDDLANKNFENIWLILQCY